nr:hypothetical protein [Rhodomicrobium sp. Az07]
MIAVEEVLAFVSGRGEDVVDAARREALAAPCVAALVEMGGDGLHTHGLTAFAERKAEDLAHGSGFVLVDDENLLLARASNLSCDHIVAERRLRSVPEALACVFEHGAMDVLGRLPRLILVEDVQHLARDLGIAASAHILGDGDEIDACLAQLADVEFRMHGIPTEAGERVHDDEVEGMIRALRLVDQLLKHGTALIEGRCAGFTEHLDNLIALLFAPGLASMDLVGDREVSFGLPDRRNACVDCGPATHITPRRRHSGWH